MLKRLLSTWHSKTARRPGSRSVRTISLVGAGTLPGAGAFPGVRARFDSAQTSAENRRHWANADGLSPNAALTPEVRRILRNRARYEVANNSYARGIALTLANDTVGTGPRLQMLLADSEANDRVEHAFQQWAQAVDLPGKLRTMRMARAESGIGQATAVLLAAHGAKVACADRNVEGAKKTAEQIVTAGGMAWACALDVADESSWQQVVSQTVEQHKQLDIMVNGAGISEAQPIADITLEHWRRIMAVNVEGVLLGTREAIRAMRLLGRGGSIVNIASISGVKAQPGASAYCSSKAAVIMLSRIAALECLQAGDRIRVNSVSPGGVRTPIWNTMPFFADMVAKEGSEEAAFASLGRSCATGRLAEPSEIAMGVLYLASDESQNVTGTNLVLDSAGA